MTRYAARKDENHSIIEDVLRQLLADHVTNCSRFGEGAPDLYCSFGKFGCWIEIKRDAKAKLTPPQIAFRRTHEGVYYVCHSVEHAEQLARYIRLQASALAALGLPASRE